MALRPQPSFASGELDPALWERTNLQKYSSALATARNVVIGKTGRLISAPGRTHMVETKVDNKVVALYGFSSAGALIEWGHQYVRVYSLTDNSLANDVAHAWTVSDIPTIQFIPVSTYTLMIVNGLQKPLFLEFNGTNWVFITNFFSLSISAPTSVSGTVNGTGYLVDYAVTAIRDGEESLPLYLLGSSTTARIPITNVINSFTVKVGTSSETDITEIRVYRRPSDGGAYGLISVSTALFTSGADRRATFTDYGQDADYAHTLPDQVIEEFYASVNGIADTHAATACLYQQRLLVAYDYFELLASRVGNLGNFYRDFPLDSASALRNRFHSKILRLIDNDGLVLFANDGVYIHTGSYSPTNLGFEKKGSWVIDNRVPPLGIPGAIIFVDSLTNTVRQLAYSQEAGTYTGEELSIFSDHLFKDNRITSWAFQSGPVPLLWVTFADGTYASFSYERNEQMKAWTRHDSGYGVYQVTSTSAGGFDFDTGDTIQEGSVAFLILKGTKRYIELVSKRYADAETIETNPEADKFVVPPMDGVVTYSYLFNDHIIDDTITVAPVTPGDWDGPLTISVTNDAIFPSPGVGAVGGFIRHFHPVDGSACTMEITARASANQVTVQPDCTFPSTYATNPRLYACTDTVTGLAHLNSEDVSIVADGYVIASPNNDIQDYPTATVSGGSVTIPGNYLGSIVHVGRPRVADIETLEIDTVEQRPVFNESKIANKVYVKTYKSGGLYVGGRFPSDDGVAGSELDGTTMVEVDSISIDYEDDTEVLANRYDAPTTKRLEVAIDGNWKSNGKICIRQVDPIHFEILSITPDLEDLRR